MLPEGHSTDDAGAVAEQAERTSHSELSPEEQAFLSYLAELVVTPTQLRDDAAITDEQTEYEQG